MMRSLTPQLGSAMIMAVTAALTLTLLEVMASRPLDAQVWNPESHCVSAGAQNQPVMGA
jgi:hypothetical protein